VNRQLNHAETLLWLNDRVGKSVHASVKLDKGDYSVTLLSVEGDLHHWRDDPRFPNPAEAWMGHSRDDIMGLYSVGRDAQIDLTTDVLGAWARDDLDSLRVALAHDVYIEVIEQS
jgi:hypothetical protein